MRVKILDAECGVSKALVEAIANVPKYHVVVHLGDDLYEVVTLENVDKYIGCICSIVDTIDVEIN